MARRRYVVYVSQVQRKTVELEIHAENKKQAERKALLFVKSGYGTRKADWVEEDMEWEVEGQVE
jgi:hypothetical protein